MVDESHFLQYLNRRLFLLVGTIDQINLIMNNDTTHEQTDNNENIFADDKIHIIVKIYFKQVQKATVDNYAIRR